MDQPDMTPEHDLLDEEYPLSNEAIAFYRENGFVKLRNVLSPESLSFFEEAVSDLVTQLNSMITPLEERDTYDRAFLQVTNLWRHGSIVRQLVFSRRLAGIAARLMGTKGTRLYHDQALFKEPSGGFTPWHADQYYWPLATADTTTVWIPFQETPLDMGPLEFAAGSHRLAEGRDIGISDESEQTIEHLIGSGSYERFVESYDLGEASFHAGWLFHRAGPNLSSRMRKVMTVIYMDSAMTLKPAENANQLADRDAWCPDAVIGEVIDTPLNPILFTS
jgi:ectoine hydroxylase-related dioxygenase (phytanoyl-CoA dioxygenase family)